MRRHWLTALAAALATLAVVGSLSFAARRAGPAAHGPGQPGPGAPTASPPADPAALVVRDGDTVEASGAVVQVPGKPPRFCAPAPVAAVGSIDGRPQTCQMGVDLAGLDATRLGPDGRALLRGTLRGGVLQITDQGPVRPEPTTGFDWRVPCPPPDGGWNRGRPDDNGLHEFIYNEHPDWFRDLRVTYPDGEPGAATDGPQPRTVFVVEIVIADHAAAERAVRARYAGDVCFVANPGAKSLADQQRDLERVRAVVERLMQEPANGIYTMRGGDAVELDMVALTPPLLERLEPVLRLIVANPWLRPVR
ncbi:hypothetical protein [Dactylosporangium sp. NPDC048998]|uniref:hypothetical protein n=1 Tax=Dactylosporangium sp. NPDC048998 TaxID=3363976 RepID=UPI0037227016